MGPLTIALSLLASPCPATPGPLHQEGPAASGPSDRAPADRAEERGEELIHVYERLRELHPDLFFGTPESDFDAALDELYGRLPELSEAAFAVELMRFVALVSREGRDGHSGLSSFAGFHHLPIQLYRFADGWFVVDARQPELLGARLVAVGETPVEAVCDALAPLLTKDNDTTLLARLPSLLIQPEVHRALGHALELRRTPLTLELSDGRVVSRTLEGLPFAEHRAWSGAPVAGLPPVPGLLWLSDTRSPWWVRVLEEERALYVQYNAVQATHSSGQSVAELGDEILRLFEERGLERVVLDLRLNGGGNNGTFPPLIAALRSNERLNRRGSLYGLIGRQTFSAAGNFVTVFQRDLNSLLVGEPTGGAPNQYGDARDVPLLHHPGLRLRVSSRYHEYGEPDDPRLTHEPDLAVRPTGRDYFEARDPVLRAALEHGR